MTELVLHGLSGLRSGTRGVVSAWVLILAIPLAVAALDPARFGDILHIAIGALTETLPFIAAAVVLIGGLKATGATALIAHAFEGRETRMIVLAALLGGLAPFCSCEVIPFIAALLAVGCAALRDHGVLAVRLRSSTRRPCSSPAGALGWEFAVGKALAAVALGLFGGFGVRLLVGPSARRCANPPVAAATAG